MNPATGQLESKPVKQIFRRTTYHLRHLTFESPTGARQTFETTDEHPFWSHGAARWIPAGDLQPGDRVIDPHGGQSQLIATHRDPHPEGVTVYNFEVEGFHSYFVAGKGPGGQPVLVHNTCRVSPKTGRLQELRPSKGGTGPNRWHNSLDAQGRFIYAPKGAVQLQGRAAELNALRRPWEASNGTTAVIKVLNKLANKSKRLIATEGKTIPKEFEGKLLPGEEFIGEIGHAEQTILENLGPDWVAVEGGASRNVCSRVCQPLVEGNGMRLGGPEFRGAADKTPFRMFWRDY